MSSLKRASRAVPATPACTCATRQGNETPALAQGHSVASVTGTRLVEIRDLTITACDGFPISATLHENRKGTGPLLLVSSAAAVPRAHYARFATFAAASGFRGVLTYDYRGTGASVAPKGWTKRITMADWGLSDLPAAARALAAIAPEREITAIGQSIGGVLFGLSGDDRRFARHAMIASGHGWLGNTDEPARLYVSLHLAARWIARLTGRAPAWLGLGMDLPRSIIEDWAAFTAHRDYLFSPALVPESGRYATVTTPTLALGFCDDRWTTRRALAALAAGLPLAPVTARWICPVDAGMKRIGHMGFFRQGGEAALWKPVLDWLDRGELSALPGRSVTP